MRWRLGDREGCWICDKWKYTVVVADTKNFLNNYAQITDQEEISDIENTYGLN